MLAVMLSALLRSLMSRCFSGRCARDHAGCDAKRAHELTDVNIQQQQHHLHHGHLDQASQERLGHRTHDRRQVRPAANECVITGRCVPL